MSQNKELELVKHLIDNWWWPLEEHGGVTEGELVKAETKLGIPLPVAVREWYQLAGKRLDAFPLWDYLMPLDKLYTIDDILIICVENQAVVSWGIPLSAINLPDPPVVYWEDIKPEDIPESMKDWPTTGDLHSPRFSIFILAQILRATLDYGNFTGKVLVSSTEIERVERAYDKLLDWTGGFLLGDSDTLLSFRKKPDGVVELELSARTCKAAAKFLALVDDTWQDKIYHNGALWRHIFLWSHTFDVNTCADYSITIISRKRYESRPNFPPCHLISRNRAGMYFEGIS